MQRPAPQHSTRQTRCSAVASYSHHSDSECSTDASTWSRSAVDDAYSGEKERLLAEQCASELRPPELTDAAAGEDTALAFSRCLTRKCVCTAGVVRDHTEVSALGAVAAGTPQVASRAVAEVVRLPLDSRPETPAAAGFVARRFRRARGALVVAGRQSRITAGGYAASLASGASSCRWCECASCATGTRRSDSGVAARTCAGRGVLAFSGLVLRFGARQREYRQRGAPERDSNDTRNHDRASCRIHAKGPSRRGHAAGRTSRRGAVAVLSIRTWCAAPLDSATARKSSWSKVIAPAVRR